MSLRLPGQDEEDLEVSHQINVTPMLDVMLVLLIIFMVAAPLATVATAVNLPDSNAPPDPRPEAPVYLSLRSDLSLVLGEREVTLDAIGPALEAATGGDRDTRIYIRGDRGAPYGALMDVMNALREEGYAEVGLVGLETRAP